MDGWTDRQRGCYYSPPGQVDRQVAPIQEQQSKNWSWPALYSSSRAPSQSFSPGSYCWVLIHKFWHAVVGGCSQEACCEMVGKDF